jgi:hypothetical protein
VGLGVREPAFRQHTEHDGVCLYDLEPWPCKSAKLLNEVAEYLIEAAEGSPKDRRYGMQCAAELIKPWSV